MGREDVQQVPASDHAVIIVTGLARPIVTPLVIIWVLKVCNPCYGRLKG